MTISIQTKNYTFQVEGKVEEFNELIKSMTETLKETADNDESNIDSESINDAAKLVGTILDVKEEELQKAVEITKQLFNIKDDNQSL